MPYKNKEKFKQYQKEWYQKNKKRLRQLRKKWYQENKEEIIKRRKKRRDKQTVILKKKAVEFLGGRCSKCGYKKCIGVFDFHHRSQVKKEFDISDMIRDLKSWTLIKKELKKCVLFCANCHREIHYHNRKK